MEKSYSYEVDLDLLYINNNFNNEKIIHNLVYGNIVLDIGNGGKILGVEIDCASKVLPFSVVQLQNLDTAQIKVLKFGDLITLNFFIGTLKHSHSLQLNLDKKCLSPIPA